MYLIFMSITIILILLNVAGLSLLTRRWIPSFALARTIGVISFCLGGFFIEHFVGLGHLHWLWPISSSISIYIIYKHRQTVELPEFYRSELIFYLAFLYVFAWRIAFPDIYPSSEHVSDLYFISNYFHGTILPPLDRWYPPHRFDVYYAFQHYSAALMGRIFNLDPGTTYNIAFALLLSLPATLAWEIGSRYLKNTGLKIILVVALVSGGTGMSPIMYFIQPSPTDVPIAQRTGALSNQVVASQRFIGTMDQSNLNHLGKFLFPPLTQKGKSSSNSAPRELPEETYGYQIFLGDYHPPSGGFMLLLLALALIAAIEHSEIVDIGQALLTATLPLVLITNAWVLPLQAFLIGAWICYRICSKQSLNWPALFAGGFFTTLLIYPFLIGFSSNVQHTSIRLVQAADHTPWRQFIAMHWPIMVLLILAVINPKHRRLNITFALAFGLMLLISELFYIHGPNAGMYIRTNTTMKWWGWIWTGGLVCLGTLNLSSHSRIVRWSTLTVMLLISTYIFALGRFYFEADKIDAGHLNGQYWLTRNKSDAALLNYLKSAKNGIVLENEFGNAYDNTSIYALFSGKPALLGWPMEITTWRHNAIDVYPLKNDIVKFYQGNMTDSENWLLAHQVRYIVWTANDDRIDPNGFNRIQNQIRQAYYWQQFNFTNPTRVGIWVAKKQTDKP